MEKKFKEHKIIKVHKGSIAEEMEIEVNDILISINDTEIEDVFDYNYLIDDDFITVLIRKGEGNADAGAEWELEIDKEYSEDLGLEFEEGGLMDNYHSCTNNCIFCFIDQMPKGMRDTLYFKDDDTRLSFLQGNYVTLTNVSDAQLDKVIKYHMCPINISVHTTNPELRVKMLHNRFAGTALKKIDKLYENAMEMNGQIVLCKNVNDGKELERTINDLSKYLPHMRSVSVVPSGVTKFRDGLYPLEPFTKEDACKVIDLIESYQDKLFNEYGLHFIHASDEWYIMAERDFPTEDRYDGYIQLENGVGMMRLLKDEFLEELSKIDSNEKIGNINISMATGYSAYPLINELAKEVCKKFPQVSIKVYKIRNDFFGETITVSGLITGIDLLNQLKGKDLGDMLILPKNMVRSGEDVFLDDMHLTELSNKLGVNVGLTGSSGKDLLYGILFNKTEVTRIDNRFVYNKHYED